MFERGLRGRRCLTRGCFDWLLEEGGDCEAQARRFFCSPRTPVSPKSPRAPCSSSISSCLFPRLSHAFAQAAFLNKGGFQSFDLSVEQIVCKLDQTKHYIGENIWGACRKDFGETCVPRCLFTFFADEHGFFGFLVPLFDAVNPQKIAVVLQEFLQTGARDIGELEFRFFGCAAGFTGFHDVLFARAGCLHHLVNGAVSSTQKTLAKNDRSVIDQHGLLIGEQLLVAPVRGEDAVAGVHIKQDSMFSGGYAIKKMGAGDVGDLGDEGVSAPPTSPMSPLISEAQL